MKDTEQQRLSKIMTQRSLCSRREADRMIKKGWVQVDGKIISTLGTKVPIDAKIEIHTEAQQEQKQKVTIILNKPVGIVSTQPEKNYTQALITEENRDTNFKSTKLEKRNLTKLAVVGRLDIDSKGLLVLTQDGRIAKKIIGENSNIEKEYLVWVEGDTPDEKQLEKLRHGLTLDGKDLKPAEVDIIKPGLMRFVLKQGRKRQIRRMCELVSMKVSGLQRIRVGNVRLGQLQHGHWRFLKPNENF